MVISVGTESQAQEPDKGGAVSWLGRIAVMATGKSVYYE
jgi:hypothetical protein